MGWTGRFVSQAHAESRGEGGGGRVSWAMEKAGNSLPRNFSYRAVGPPPGRTSPPAYVAEWAGVYANPMPESTISSQSYDYSKNLATAGIVSGRETKYTHHVFYIILE